MLSEGTSKQQNVTGSNPDIVLVSRQKHQTHSQMVIRILNTNDPVLGIAILG